MMMLHQSKMTIVAHQRKIMNNPLIKEKPFLCDIINNDYSTDAVKIFDGMTPKKTSFRVNTALCDNAEVKNFLDYNKIKYHNPEFYMDAFILDTPYSIHETNLFKEGKIYLQNPSSMLPAIILEPKDNTDIIDMAAAPGGKTLLLSNLAPKSHITACEKDKIRSEKLKYNLNMQGAKNCFVMNIDSTKIEDYYKFDSVLLDSPCSGVGTIDIENKKSYEYLSQKLINNLTLLQKKLLDKAITICKKNGTIIYSTCSLLKRENEDIVNHFIKSGRVKTQKINIFDVPVLSENNNMITVMPTDEYQGFFIAKLIKL